MIKWDGRRVLVTGGASFIGSHLVEALIERGASVRVADNLSSGRLENLGSVRDDIEFMEGDLKHWEFASDASKGCETVGLTPFGRLRLARSSLACFAVLLTAFARSYRSSRVTFEEQQDWTASRPS